MTLLIAIFLLGAIVIDGSRSGGGIGSFAMAFVANPTSINTSTTKRYVSIQDTEIEEDEASDTTILGRRIFVASIAAATTSFDILATIAATTRKIITLRSASADEPNNIYYKSKADIEDPLVVFGKSLENMNSGSNDSSSSNNSRSSVADTLSFSDIALPTSKEASSSRTPIMEGDLGRALKEKKDSQKRAVDPRTHG